MLGQFIQALSGTMGPCLLVMCMNVLLTVGEGREKPASHRWRLIGLIVGLIASVIFAVLRATAVIDRRSTVNLPTLIVCVIVDVLMIIVVLRAHALTNNWQRARAAFTGHMLPIGRFAQLANNTSAEVTVTASTAVATETPAVSLPTSSSPDSLNSVAPATSVNELATESANESVNESLLAQSDLSGPSGSSTSAVSAATPEESVSTQPVIASNTANIKHAELWMNIANAIAAVSIAFTTFYALPDVILQLTSFVDTGDSPFTSDMLMRALGFLLGIGAAMVATAIFRTLQTTSVWWAFTFAALVVVVLQFAEHMAELFSLMMNMLILVLSGTPFRILIFFHNHELEMTYGQVLIFLIPAIASMVVGFRTAKTGPNDAAVRSRIAFRRRAKAASAWSVVAIGAVIVSLAWGTYEENKEPIISEPEEYSLVDGVATISFAQVSDGHLHRFEYTASDGTVMRFIIIQKNGGAYGIGLDACETCGDAGYYEEDGKIICKRCDVAINLATIGFKGGCNPVPLDYEIGDGSITIQASDLDELSAHFQ